MAISATQSNHPTSTQNRYDNADVQEAARTARTHAPTSRPEHNSVQAAPPPPPPPTSPTTGAIEVTANNPAGYAKDPLEELKQSPEYQDLQLLLQLANTLEEGQGLYQIDHAFGGVLWSGIDDGVIDRGNIQAAADAGYAAAKMLLNNPRLFSLLDADGNGAISATAVRNYIATTKAQLKAMEDAARQQAASQQSAGVGTQATAVPQAVPLTQATQASAGGNSSATGNATGGADEAGGKEPAAGAAPSKRPPSSRPGIDGALENVGNAAESIQEELIRLSNESAADPTKAAANQGKIALLQNQLQALMNMQNQLMTMMSNLSKMFSDIAMNSIRNIR